MDILLLAGSNAGLRDGWAAQFMELASEHRVSNQFLGAVGSLFGLLRLLKHDRENAPKPDLIIFEYALNDAILLDDCGLSFGVLRDTLDEVAQYCGQNHIRLMFLCLQARDARKGFFSPTSRVHRAYSHVTKTRGMRPCLTLEDILGGPANSPCFQDPYHLTQPVSRLVAERLKSLVQDEDIPAPLIAPRRPKAFSYVTCESAVARGPARLRDIESKVFSGKFLEIERSGASFWPDRGWLVALMLRSSEAAGVFMLKNSTSARRKCSASMMQQTVVKLILLHYLSRRFYVDDDLEISMPEDANTLFSLEKDGSMQEAAPSAPFPAQCLEINGVVLWRPTSLWARLWAAAFLAAERQRSGRI